MNEQFDKELRDHIKDTFDVYNDRMEHDGWLKYERKVRRKKFRAIFMWSLPGGMAAAIALLWLLNAGQHEVSDTTNQTEIVANNPGQKPGEEKNITSKISGSKESESRIHRVESNSGEFAYSSSYAVSQATEDITGTENFTLAMADSVTVAKDPELVVTNVSGQAKDSSSVSNQEITGTKRLLSTPSANEFITNTPRENINAFNQQETGFNNNFADLAANAYTENTIEKAAKGPSASKKLKVGLDASTFMNFTKDGLSQDMNLGVGLVSEYKISKNFSINSGININKQSASYIANNDNVRESFKNAAPLNGLIAMASPLINHESLTAKLVGFDIPFAVKYSSNNKNLNWFLSTGFSSYTLLTETYLNNFSVVNYGFNGIQTTNEVQREEHKDGLFSNLQLARTLNFSVGLQFPIKNVTSLSVEPFIKYPLRSFGREDLTIGSSGVSLKMNLDKRLFK